MVPPSSAHPRFHVRDAPARRKLVQRHDLPPRVRQVLAGLHTLCTEKLSHSFGAALDAFEQKLFDLASRALSASQSERDWDSLREVRRARLEMTPSFLAEIEDALATFDQQSRCGDAQLPPPLQLSLVDEAELEDALSLQEAVIRSESRQTLMLHDIGHRFGVLAGQPAFEGEHIPLGPAQIMTALARAGASLDIADEHRVLLYRIFDRVALSDIRPLYVAMNAFFADRRILRNLRMQAPRRQGGRSMSPEQAPGASAAVRAGLPQDSRGAHPGSEAADDSGLPGSFGSLRELLAGQRGTRNGRSRADVFVPGAGEIESVLSQLQTAPFIAARAPNAQRRVARIKQELLKQLRERAPDGRKARLDGEDSDAIDLVGLLFDYMEKNTSADGSTRKLLTQLQVPLLRIALRDKNFFTQRTHPARRLLNAIAEAGTHWIDDSEGEPDPVLLKKVHTIVERLNGEFDGDPDRIERMLGDLSRHVVKLEHKAEVAERRLIDATKGREKLALARETAADAISGRIAARKPKRLLRTMLERAWTDVLALTMLRQGEHSDAYRHQLTVADQLLAAADAAHAGDKPPSAALRQDVEKGLSQVGYHHDEIRAVVRHLLAPAEVPVEEDPASQTDVAIRLKSKSHLGQTVDEEKPLEAAQMRRATLRLNADEEQMVAQLKGLAFGTWFEFAVNQQGERARRKLSWFSPVTGHCLFVNARGVRVARANSLEQLAREIVRGQASMVAREQESLIDRAWNAVVGSLRQLTGGARTAPVPA